MFLSIFGDLEYGNYQSVEDWADAHQQAHRSISRAAAGIGVPISSGLLTGEHIDDNWMGRHGLIHVALQRFLRPGSSTSSQAMVSSLSDWLTESSFYNWHQTHDYIHTQLNAYLGVH
jgi:hypothetical protein